MRVWIVTSTIFSALGTLTLWTPAFGSERSAAESARTHVEQKETGPLGPVGLFAVQSVPVPYVPEGSGTVGASTLATSAGLPPDALLPGKPATAHVVMSAAAIERGFPLQKDCWVKLFDEDGFQGDAITLLGPIEIPDVDRSGVFGINWKDRIGSISTGPVARVLIYDNTHFRDLVSTINPGREEVSVAKKTGFFDQITSMQVLCEKVG